MVDAAIMPNGMSMCPSPLKPRSRWEGRAPEEALKQKSKLFRRFSFEILFKNQFCGRRRNFFSEMPTG